MYDRQSVPPPLSLPAGIGRGRPVARGLLTLGVSVALAVSSAVTATAPRRFVPQLAALFLYAERPEPFNRLLARLQRRQTGDDLAGLARR